MSQPTRSFWEVADLGRFTEYQDLGIEPPKMGLASHHGEAYKKVDNQSWLGRPSSTYSQKMMILGKAKASRHDEEELVEERLRWTTIT